MFALLSELNGYYEPVGLRLLERYMAMGKRREVWADSFSRGSRNLTGHLTMT